jgi:hypothetical protein
VTRILATNDRFVSAHDVFEASDMIFHFGAKVSRSERERRLAQLTFTGEFPLAGSYGFLQMTYVTALDLQWNGVNPPCDGATSPLDPSGLYDTPCNLQNGGGSLGVGAKKVRLSFIDQFTSMPTISGMAGFLSRMKDAYEAYNPGEKKYGSDVIAFSQTFLPVSDRKIFGSGATQ